MQFSTLCFTIYLTQLSHITVFEVRVNVIHTQPQLRNLHFNKYQGAYFSIFDAFLVTSIHSLHVIFIPLPPVS